ncbi:MAG TPA: peptidase M23 [Gammaproteobacteria bacterium]|nr:peptidase M23 [Gammaproteobacteria bacterium]
MKSFLTGFFTVIALAALIIWLLPEHETPPEKESIELSFPEQREILPDETALIPDDEDVTEDVAAEALPGVIESKPLLVIHQVRAGDTLLEIFNKLGIDKALYQQFILLDKKKQRLARLRPGQMLHFQFSIENNLVEIIHNIDSTRSTSYLISDDDIQINKHQKEVQVKIETAHGTIASSLFSDGIRAGMTEKLIINMAKLFNWDIDFGRELKKGDYFGVIYEANYVDGQRIGTGNILAAEFINGKKKHRVIRYVDSRDKVDYLDPQGRSRRQQFIRTPLSFTRISSKFTGKRWHPVLRRWRSHKGVDYAAPKGTPVWATADGTVSIIGRQRGYGKVIYLKHGKYTTVYGHLSAFKRGMTKGRRVRQNEVIGYVGSTGLATGPHLHYEFRINGKHVNPLSHRLPIADAGSRKSDKKFRSYADPLLKTLDQLKDETMHEASTETVSGETLNKTPGET